VEHTAAFWTVEALEVFNAFTYGGTKAAQYPLWRRRSGAGLDDDPSGIRVGDHGGSIPKVLEIHDNTMRECARVYTSSPHDVVLNSIPGAGR
jgi:hypothetical protein